MENKNKYFKVGSLYAGIGGICRAFINAGAKVVWANEWDKYACMTYRENFSHRLYEEDVEDFIKKDLKEAEDIDILTSGFPCQAFSIAGYRKGFKDERGNHFFKTIEVLNKKRPKAFLFENVKNLRTHDNGNTYRVIVDCIKHAKYHLITLCLNTMNHGNIPQNRERIYLVGFKNKAAADIFPNLEKNPIPLTVKIKDLLKEGAVDPKYYYKNFDCYNQLKEQIRSSNTIYQWRRVYVRENKKNVCPTLTANMGTGGHNVPLIKDRKGIRKLTPEECANFQGLFNWKFPNIADSHKYKQIGNSVSIPVVTRIAKAMIQTLEQFKK